MSKLNVSSLRKFTVFGNIIDTALAKLAASGEVRQIDAGQIIIQKIRDADQIHLLLSGSVEIRTSFFERNSFSHSDFQALKPLEDAATNGVAVTATTKCMVVKFFRTQVEAAETEPFIADNATAIDRGSVRDAYQVAHSASREDDWLSRFLMSPMVGHLSASDIHRMLSNFTEIHVTAGQVIIETGQPGDLFYIIKTGTAEVTTANFGSDESAEIALTSGDYFGEEALIGETVRNASVVMKSDGVLCAMDKFFFNEVLRKAVVITAEESHVNHLLSDMDDEQVVLDIRFYPEYCEGHRKFSRNLPISQLRNQLSQLDGKKQYFITPEGGARSELATFILRQAGFDAVLIKQA